MEQMEWVYLYYEKEPIVANIALLVLVLTPGYVATLRFLNKRNEQQTQRLRIDRVTRAKTAQARAKAQTQVRSKTKKAGS